MNLWACISVFFATVSIILLYALIAQSDTNKQLRHTVNHLWRANLANESHLAACSELLNEYQVLERHNQYLEACHDNFKGIIAGAKLMAPGVINEDERFTVRWRQGEAP